MEVVGSVVVDERVSEWLEVVEVVVLVVITLAHNLLRTASVEAKASAGQLRCAH